MDVPEDLTNDAEAALSALDLTFTYSPWRYAGGTMRGMVGSAQDVTDVVLARRAAEAEHAGLRARYEEAQQTVTALQEALLPTRLPVLPEVDLSARYLLAATDTAAGGDWFDAVVLEDGRVALMVGDVVGHGVRGCPRPAQRRPDVLHSRPSAAVDRLHQW